MRHRLGLDKLHGSVVENSLIKPRQQAASAHDIYYDVCTKLDL